MAKVLTVAGRKTDECSLPDARKLPLRRTRLPTSGAHDVIAIRPTSSQKNDLCTEEHRDRPKTLEEVSLPLRKARFGCLVF